MQATTTRRAMLGALAVIPAACVAPLDASTFPADRSTWDARMSELRAVQAGMEAADRAFEAEYGRQGEDAAASRCDALGNRLCNLEMRQLQTPAPDGEAVAWKLDNLFRCKDDSFTDSLSADMVVPVLDEARRFLIGVRS